MLSSCLVDGALNGRWVVALSARGGRAGAWVVTTAAKKATLNMTRGDIDDGDLMALTEDARYRNEVLDDDYDFM
jgi:hypothetical protein